MSKKPQIHGRMKWQKPSIIDLKTEFSTDREPNSWCKEDGINQLDVSINQLENSREFPTSEINQIEDRISRLKYKVEELDHPRKENEKLKKKKPPKEHGEIVKHNLKKFSNYKHVRRISG